MTERTFTAEDGKLMLAQWEALKGWLKCKRIPIGAEPENDDEADEDFTFGQVQSEMARLEKIAPDLLTAAHEREAALRQENGDLKQERSNLRDSLEEAEAALAEAQREIARLDCVDKALVIETRRANTAESALAAERQKVRQVFRYGFAAGCSATHGDTPHPKFIDPVKESKAWENTSAALGLTDADRAVGKRG